MITLIDKENGHRAFNYGSDGMNDGNAITDQFIAIIYGWALGIWEGK